MVETRSKTARTRAATNPANPAPPNQPAPNQPPPNPAPPRKPAKNKSAKKKTTNRRPDNKTPVPTTSEPRKSESKRADSAKQAAPPDHPPDIPGEPGGDPQGHHSKIPLHTIIFFPIDYDDPSENEPELASGAHADNALCTGQPKFMIRSPPLPSEYQLYFTRSQLPSYFQNPKFEKVQKRLRYTYLNEDNRKVTGPSYANKTEHDGGSIKYLHQMAVFFELLKEEPYNFRSIYAGNLHSAKRNAKRLTDEIARLHPKSPTLTKTPVSATSGRSSVDPYKDHQSPVSTGGSRLIDHERVMVLTYRQTSNVLLNARANEPFFHEDVLLYPSVREVGWDSSKTYDILAFEAINEKRKNTWRPLSHICNLTNNPAEYVCDIQKNHKERYDGRRQILKRSHSSCVHHVKGFEWEEWKEPGCWGTLQLYRRQLQKMNVSVMAPEEPAAPEAEEPAAPAAEEPAAPAAEEPAAPAPEAPEEPEGSAAPPTEESAEPANKSAKLSHTRKREAASAGVDFQLDEARFYNYIHQEYVDCFDRWGELRVFIAMRYVKDANGRETDKREPYVVEIIKTRWTDKKRFPNRLEKEEQRRNGLDVPGTLSEDDNVIVADDRDPGPDNAVHVDGKKVPLERCTYHTANMGVTRYNLHSTKGFQSPYQAVNLQDVKKFALAQYRRLYRRFPRTFKSFDVGTRIDLGIGPDNKSLFINEVTRWWWAAWFCSYEDVGRQDVVPKAFAKSFAEVYVSAAGNTDGNDDDGDDDKGGDDGDEGGNNSNEEGNNRNKEGNNGNEGGNNGNEGGNNGNEGGDNGDKGDDDGDSADNDFYDDVMEPGEDDSDGGSRKRRKLSAKEETPLWTDEQMVEQRNNKTLEEVPLSILRKWLLGKDKVYKQRFVKANTMAKEVRKILREAGL